MTDPEDLQSELLALRQLYGLLINEGQYVQNAVSENLDKNSRQLLLNLLDATAKKAFEAHAKMVGTQYRPTYYSLWSTTQFPSLQNLDLITSQGIFNEPRTQVVSSTQSKEILPGEPEVKLKRCRVCQRPKVKQLTREISIQDNQQQSHKRSWEDQNNPYGVGGLPCSSHSPLTVDYVKSLALYNQNDEDDQISREASAKIQQIESCISALRVASNRVNLLEDDNEGQYSQVGNFAVGTISDPNGQWFDQTARRIEELTVQSQPLSTRVLNMMFPSSQTMSQELEKVSQIKNHHDPIPEETYSEVSLDLTKMPNKNRPLQMAKKEPTRVSEITQWLTPPAKSTVHGHESQLQETEIPRRKKPDQDYMDHYKGKHVVVDRQRLVSPETSDGTVSMSNYSSSGATESQSQQAYTSCNDSEESYKGHEGSGSGSESESEMYSVSSPDQSTDISSSDESSGSKSTPRSKSKRMVPTKGYKRGNQKEQKISSDESSGSNSTSRSKSKKMVPTKGYKKRNHKEPKISSDESSGSKSTPRSRSKSKSMIPTKWYRNRKEPKVSSDESSGSNSTSRSKPRRKMVPTKLFKSGNKKEPRFSSDESSGSKSTPRSKSKKLVPITWFKRGKQKEPKMSSNESSVSKSSSRSKSRKMIPIKGNKRVNQKEPKIVKVGRLKKLKDTLGIIFHHHQHHHHHHHHHHGEEDNPKKTSSSQEHKEKKGHGDGDVDNHKKSSPKHAEKVVDHGRKKEEAHGEKVVDHGKKKEEAYGEKVAEKNHKQLVVHKLGAANNGQLKALMGGFLKHTRDSKKSKKGNKSEKAIVLKGVSGKSGGGRKTGKKMSWLKMLQQQRKIKRADKLRGKINFKRK